MIVWPGVVVSTCNSGLWEVEARGSRINSPSWLPGEIEPALQEGGDMYNTYMYSVCAYVCTAEYTVVTAAAAAWHGKPLCSSHLKSIWGSVVVIVDVVADPFCCGYSCSLCLRVEEPVLGGFFFFSLERCFTSDRTLTTDQRNDPTQV